MPLGFLGMPGCDLLVSNEFVQFVGNRPTPNTALWSLPIPNQVNLVGASFFQQVLVTDPGTNAGGIVASNAGQATIGACQ